MKTDPIPAGPPPGAAAADLRAASNRAHKFHRTIGWTLDYRLNPARRGHDPHSIKGQYQAFNARRSRRRPSRYCPLTGKVSHSRVTEPADLCPVRALAERSLTIRSTEGDERRLAVTLAVSPAGPLLLHLPLRDQAVVLKAGACRSRFSTPAAGPSAGRILPAAHQPGSRICRRARRRERRTEAG